MFSNLCLVVDKQHFIEFTNSDRLPKFFLDVFNKSAITKKCFVPEAYLFSYIGSYDEATNVDQTHIWISAKIAVLIPQVLHSSIVRDQVTMDHVT